MDPAKPLLVAIAILMLTSSARAGEQWWQYRYAEAPWHWVCGAFEARHKCNAVFKTFPDRCGCLMH
jgi:hypothetical protein